MKGKCWAIGVGRAAEVAAWGGGVGVRACKTGRAREGV